MIAVLLESTDGAFTAELKTQLDAKEEFISQQQNDQGDLVCICDYIFKSSTISHLILYFSFLKGSRITTLRKQLRIT